MKFSVAQEVFNTAVQFTKSIIDNKSPAPIYNNLLIEAVDGELTVTSVSSKTEKRVTINEKVKVSEPGSITIPANRLSDIVKPADKDKNITISIKDGKARITSGRSRYSVSTMPAEEFPEFNKVEDGDLISIDAKQLVDSMRKCAPAMADNDARHYLNGMCFNFVGDRLETVASDGHRMMICNIETGSNYTGEVIIPNKAAKGIIQMIAKADNAEIRIKGNSMTVIVGDMEMTTKLVDGKYVDYKRVIPQGNDLLISFDKEELKTAISRTLPISNEKYRGLVFTFAENELSVSASSTNQDEGEEVIPCTHDGEELNIGFNGQYVLDALSSIDSETADIYAKDSGSPILIKEDYYTAIVMPMRI